MKKHLRIVVVTLGLTLAASLNSSAQQRDFTPSAPTGHVIMTKQTVGSGLWQTFEGPSIPYGAAYAFSGIVSAKAFGDYSAAFEIKGLIRNYGTQVAFVGTPTVTLVGRDRPAFSIAIDTVRSAANRRLQFLVKDDLGLSTRWTMVLDSAMTAH